ncbi:probable G-protein coupled receptor AH9.1 [Procambarus clarkii]|uniref:G protein-coupled receptor n=1 Tax=Procambarus clarkii TaxID=6728 RepID=Q9GRE7_PROCL|nr:probable G-protein coupled receptor AH9.1 [Procambarus clarkii]XP_045605330.1 probable G-protein coupled receptor AH9.1 [Procambarus clarkii]XP_045605331.1 probable G-protein coupled receptor AH9.1 [Procambarus clarkii]XP_045605332.1 probable G-protein coupled receptor AH9.1 [Procambarus clarkii]BAB20671.1 G protein-coupled receptor [Procambarus clarkii]
MPVNTSISTPDGVPEGDAGDAQLALVEDVAYRYIMPAFISVSVLTNLMNVVMLGRARRQHQQRQAQATTFFYLMWLALTEMLASLALVPALAHLDRSHLSYGWAFYYAHFETPVLNALTSASVYIVVGLSVDRYIAVCHPRRYQDVSAPRLAVSRITLSLLVPALLYIPHGFYQKVVAAQGGAGWTYEGLEMAAPRAWYAWNVVVELCHRMAPATLLAALNACIIYTFKKVTSRRRLLTKSKGTESTNKSEDNSKGQQEHRLIYLLMAIVTTFLLTNLPATVLALIDTAGASHGSFSLEVFRAVANCLEVLGFSLNFVLYFVFVPGVRQGLNEALLVVRKSVCGLVVHAKAAHGCSYSFGEDRSKDTEYDEV